MCVNQKVLYYNSYLKDKKFNGTLILDRTSENVKYCKDLVSTFGGIASFVKCGKCIECQNEKSLEWSLRCLCEFETNKNPCYFLTLTYDDEHLKSPFPLPYDLRLFFNNLWQHGFIFKYFSCGEIGDNTKRPHFHIILWLNKPIDDLVKYDNNLYTSETLDKLWSNRGAVKVGITDLGSIFYTAGYVNKKLDLNFKNDRKLHFMRFSKGIGLDYFNKHCLTMLKDDKLYFNGRSYGLPRYFSKLLKLKFPVEYDKLNKKRFKDSFEDFNISNKKESTLYFSQKQKEKLLKEFAKLKKQRDII